MTTKRTTKSEKYLNSTKLFWNKLSKPWRHHLKSLNNRKIYGLIKQNIKKALSNEAIVRKWFYIVKDEKNANQNRKI